MCLPVFAPLLEKIEILGQNERKSYGLDGFRMWYEPFELLNTYQEQGRKNQSYASTQPVSSFVSASGRKKKEETRWNLACDLVTEYTIDCLKLPYLTGDVQAQRKEIYQNFWKKGEGKTAGQIYESLSQYSDTEIKNWERIFASDSHELWRKLTEEEIEGLKTQWEKSLQRLVQKGI